MGVEPVDPVAQGVDGLLGPAAFQGQDGGGLGAMEQHEPAELLVRGDVILLVAVAADEVHQGEGVVGILDGLVVAAQGQPGDAPVVELDEFAVGLGALRCRHHPRRGLAARRLAPARGAMAQVVEIGGEPMRPQAIGPAADLELEHAQLDPDLQDRPAVAGADLAGQDLAGLGVVRPTLDHVIQVPTHRWPPPCPDPMTKSGPKVPVSPGTLMNYIIALTSDP